MPEDILHFLANRAERRIAEAQEQGQFDHLNGEGRPLPEEDFPDMPGELRMAFKVLKNAGYVPPEIAERKEVDSILEILESCEEETEKIRQMRKLDAILFRMRTRSNRSPKLDESDPYYENVIRRISIIRRSLPKER